MVRALPALALGGCIWFGELRDADVLDADEDGFPRVMDCNDQRRPITVMVATEDPLGCGERVDRVLCPPPDDDDDDDVSSCGEPDLENRSRIANWLDVLPCDHPQVPGQLLQVSAFERIHRVEVEVPSRVHVRLEMLASLPRRVLATLTTPQHAILVANRGWSCARDTCAIGLPLAEPDERIALREASVRFDAEPGEPWFVVASGGYGDYALTVDCEPVGGE